MPNVSSDIIKTTNPTVDELFEPDPIKVHKTRRTLISSKKPKNQTSLGKRTQSRSIEPATKKPPGNGLHLDRSPAQCHGHFSTPITQTLNFNSEDDGSWLTKWGRTTLTHGSIPPPPYDFLVPHDSTLMNDRNLVCVSDRGNGRIECFQTTNGSFAFNINSPRELGSHLYSASYTSAADKKSSGTMLMAILLFASEQHYWLLH
ncbi:hypothetical protein V9T40_005333 [Parthenolecanium corni]|uniref:Uncharacterized protein n=1 Tax=Parthenolecanium corni TaxID=536013 RepID=A0AAN9TGP7_9HEMI